MDIQQLVRELKVQNKSKIVMLVADGLGGLPIEPGGPTELEAANTPNLDKLAKHGVQGSMYPIAPGITPGSGPGHLGLFGYDPVKHLIGRGASRPPASGSSSGRRTWRSAAISARSTPPATSATAAPGGFPARKAARWPSSSARSRCRASRCSSSRSRSIASWSSSAAKGSAATWPTPIRSRPACRRLDPVAHDQQSRRTAEVAKQFVAGAQKLLAGQPKANGLTMRGFSAAPADRQLRRRLRSEGRRDRRLSDVQGLGPIGRHGGGRRSRRRFPKRSTCWKRRGTTTISSSSISSTPTAAARTAIFPRRCG